MYCLIERKRSAATRRREVTRRPQHTFPVSPDEIRVLLAQNARRHPFEAVDELRERNLWRVVHKQVNVIVCAVKLNELGLKVTADGGYNRAHRIQMCFGEYVTA